MEIILIVGTILAGVSLVYLAIDLIK